MASRKALGKGLSALIPEAEDLAGAGTFFQCPVEAIEPNPYQPRKKFGAPPSPPLLDSILISLDETAPCRALILSW